MPRIAICEPVCTDLSDTREGQVVFLNVTPGFLGKLKERPATFEDDITNAFVFGRPRRLHSYEHAGDVFNDAASVGIIIIDKGTPSKADIAAEWDAILEANRKAPDYIQALFDGIKEKFPHIIFLGQTNGGDVGASVYTHVDDDGDIDGLVIDNAYFFNDESSSVSDDTE